MLCAAFLDEGIEATSAEVALDLPIPPLCFELREPLAETTKLLGRELADGPLELFNGHVDSLPEGALSPARAPIPHGRFRGNRPADHQPLEVLRPVAAR